MEASLKVQSPAFGNGDTIPVRYTADGENVSPPLSWSAGPYRTVAYALVVDDPDAPAGNWVHWVAWNIPGVQIEEGISPSPRLPSGAVQGRNSWKRTGYGGPQPPSGTHRYFFRVHALDAQLDLSPDAGKEELERVMRGHVLASGEMMGKYTRKK